MYRKNEERRQSLSSEFRNAFIVKNKCEQLKLEKQHKSLDRLRAHESLDLMNKKREILSLQMSILSSKPDDCNNELLSMKQEASQPEEDISGTRKMKLRSSALSISASRISTNLSSTAKERQICTSSLNSNAERLSQYKRWAHSSSVSENLDIISRSRRNLATQRCKQDENTNESVEEEKSSSGQAVWNLLPPIQLAPLHKQKLKSFKDISSKAPLNVPKRKLSMSPTRISWNELQDCRYLRGGWKNNSCSES